MKSRSIFTTGLRHLHPTVSEGPCLLHVFVVNTKITFLLESWNEKCLFWVAAKGPATWSSSTQTGRPAAKSGSTQATKCEGGRLWQSSEWSSLSGCVAEKFHFDTRSLAAAGRQTTSGAGGGEAGWGMGQPESVSSQPPTLRSSLQGEQEWVDALVPYL